MKVLLSLVLLTIFCAGIVSAQRNDDKPNFTGTWISNPKKSYYQIPNSALLNDFKHCTIFLMITHKEPELKIISKWVCLKPNEKTKSPEISETANIYYTDGREEQSINRYSLANWKKEKLTIIIKNNFNNPRDSVTSKTVYYLSKDGKNLIQKYEHLSDQRTGLSGMLGGVRTITFDLKQ